MVMQLKKRQRDKNQKTEGDDGIILDGHIHADGARADKAAFAEGLSRSGVSGGLVISNWPAGFFSWIRDLPGRADGRLDALFLRTQGNPLLFPFFWIDPTEPDAGRQADLACSYGVAGFKVICNCYHPWEERPMSVFRRIARMGKPILFHSGILWDGTPSSMYSRPAGFESLLTVEGLRFALAHASWPWIDECIALYGKFQNAASAGATSAEMFIDITPGTPEIYRRELLTKLFRVGYDVGNNIFFGTDNSFDSYDAKKAKDWISLDRTIYEELALEETATEKVFSGNLLRFLGKG